MLKTATIQAVCAAAIVLVLGGMATGWAQSPSPSPAPTPAPTPDLSGTYQCQPDPTPCRWSGPSPSVSQSGTKAVIKNDKGEVADAVLTSNITISAGGPLNSLGIVRPDNTIDWSNGTKWRKQ